MNDDDLAFAKLKTKIEEFSTVVVVIIGFAILMSMANCWYSEDEVREEIMTSNSYVSEVSSFNRNFVDYSIVTYVERGKIITCCLDTNIFFRYEFKECPPPSYDDFYSP
jgi:hypothetical protein